VSISPEVTPLALKPAPEMPTFEMVTLALPLFVSATLSELLLPVFTLPKLKLVVLNPSTLVDATPVPLSGIESGELGELLTSVIEPETAPAVVGAKTALKVVFLPARIVSGALMPEMLNPAPATLTDEIVRLAAPPFDTVIVCELLVPVETLPKAALDGVAAICGCVPVPLSAIVSGEFGALLTSEMLPVALPAVVGANWAVKVAIWPALIVNGAAMPVMLKPAPEAVAWESVTLAVPEFVKVTVCEPELPTATEPKVMDVELAVSCPCEPLPVMEIVVGEFGALLTSEMLPVALPAVVGANWAVKVAIWPALIVNGVAMPVMLKPAPEAVAWESVTLAVPEFVKVTVCEPELPTATEPKVMDVELAVSCPCEPLPVMEIVVGEFGALLTIEIEPLALPPAVGANCAVNDVLCPAAKILGVASPLMLNPTPVAVACEIVKLAAPPFVKVTVCDPVLPVTTEPNVTTAGLAPSCPCTPVPDIVIADGEPDALLTIEMLPVVLPADVGANVALNEALPPALTVIGMLAPLTPYPAPDAVN
jgi:hypothetical protein